MNRTKTNLKGERSENKRHILFALRRRRRQQRRKLPVCRPLSAHLYGMEKDHRRLRRRCRRRALLFFSVIVLHFPSLFALPVFVSELAFDIENWMMLIKHALSLCLPLSPSILFII